MKVSLIITTYNWKPALELVLESVRIQSELPFEVIVADDGSTRDVGDMVRQAAERFPAPLHHVWQEDRGFRAAMIRNKAMARASGEYIVSIDGDIIVHRNFVEDHKGFAQPGVFVQGPRVLLSEACTAKVLREKKLSFSPFDSGLSNRKNAVRSAFLSGLFSRRANTLKGTKSCNLAFWKADAIAVNGFNEDFVGWGREDGEFVQRLMNRGLVRRNIRFKAIAHHLHHAPRSRAGLDRNDGLLRDTAEDRSTWCRNGIDKYLGGGPD